MIQIELSNPSFESCIKCIHSDDSEETCILRRCIHAVAQLKECYVPKKPTIEPQQKWIPCSKELPERNRVVLVTTKWDEVTEGVKLSGNAWFIGRGEENAFDSDIIAWMPKPEPYKEGR